MLGMGIKDLRHPDQIPRILGEMTFPLLLGNVEGIIISCIFVKVEIIIFIDDFHRLLCLLYSIPDHLYILIVI